MSEGRTRPKTLVLSAILALALVAGAWMLHRGAASAMTVAVNGPKLFDQVSSLVRDQFVDTVSDSRLHRMAVDGMLSELNDPYDAYLTPDRLARLSEHTSGSYAGIGLQVDVRDGSLVVVNPLSGGPGDRAGILTGDRIAQIDGKTVGGWTPEEVQRLLRGAAGSEVQLTIDRAGMPKPLTLTLTRADIHHSAVRRAAVLPSRVGYVALSVFSDSTARELARTTDSLVSAGAASLIVDLRSNPGGLLDQGIGVAGLFLDRGERIVSTRGRDSAETKIYLDSAAQRWPKLPIVLLVDDKTASAAEVVAGALQDHDRAVVMGAPTYGKGSVQHVFPVPAGGALRLTTARWVTPAGRLIARDIAPDADMTDSAALHPSFKTDAGRTVLGGGGITPDVLVGDTVAAPENVAFMRALGANVGLFHDALASYALTVKAKGAVKSPDFIVTPAMRDDIYRRMVQRGVDVPRGVYDDAAPLVSRLLAYEVDRYVFGVDAEFRRKAADDKTLIEAQRLLAGSHSQADAIERAAAMQRARERASE